jgi:hypothetical protein
MGLPYPNKDKCFECGEKPSFWITSLSNSKYPICSECIHIFEGKSTWTIEPMKPETADNCAFFKHGWTPGGKNAWGEKGLLGMSVCDGPIVGECEISYWEPLCKAHYEFSETKNTESANTVNGWIKLRPLSGQTPMKQTPVIQPATEIPEFCEYCEGTDHTKPPEFKVSSKNGDTTRYLCKNCVDNSGVQWLKNATITPLGEDSGMKNELIPSFANAKEHVNATGNMWICDQKDTIGFDGTENHFGNTYRLKKLDSVNSKFACDNHTNKFVEDGYKVVSYGTSEVWEQVFEGKEDNPHIPDCLLPYLKSPENGQVPMQKFDSPQDHKKSFGNEFYCTQEYITGFDGTPKHFGHVYYLQSADGLKTLFACDNHAGNYAKDGYGVLLYGLSGQIIEFKKPEIPDCLKPYIPGTIENCWFRVFHKENVDWGVEGYPQGKFGFSGLCNGPQVGTMGVSAVCKAHWDFVTEQNKLGNFATLTPLSGQKTAKKPVKKKAPEPYTVRTQKAKGLQALKDTYFPVPGFQIFDVKKTNPDELVGKFVRPCPMRPRHGFVDSRTVSSREDAEKIITETLAADPDAEFLLMEYVPAPFSGIWTPGYLAIGTGTDGATAGKTAITIPIMGDYLNTSNYGASARSKASIESAPYVEILWRKMSQNYEGLTVQLRDGPKLPEGTEDYIPSEFTVEHIILADGDLLEWEEKMRHTACNSVVWHPNGTMASHYAIHAILNKVPLLITREPKVGEILKPTENGPGEVNIDLIRAGFAIACEQEISMPEAAYFMLLGCHQTGQWLGKFDILLGASMGFAYRLAMTAALGEERHYDKSSSSGSRDAVYKKFWMKADTQTGRTKFLDALEKFLNGHLWPGSNYGGKAWYQFTSQAVIMYNSLIRKDHKTAMEAMNVLINAAHNSGWGFNKFISQSEMTQTAKNPIYSGFKVGPSLYQILTATNETVKSAARSFWKRKELILPADKGTGMGKFKEAVSGHDEDDDEEHESLCDDESCLECHPKPPHIYSESCGCDICKKTLWQMGASKPQVVTQAHVKVVFKGSTKSLAHIQYKSASCASGPFYYTKDIIPAPKAIRDMYKNHIGKFDTSYAGSETPYIVMVKNEVKEGNGFPDGWGLIDPGGNWHKLLDLEVTPNAS